MRNSLPWLLVLVFLIAAAGVVGYVPLIDPPWARFCDDGDTPKITILEYLRFRFGTTETLVGAT